MNLSLKNKQLKFNNITNDKNNHGKINIFTLIAYNILKNKYSKFLVFGLLVAISFSFLGIYLSFSSAVNKFKFAFFNLNNSLQISNLFSNNSIMLNFMYAWYLVFTNLFFAALLAFCIITLYKCLKIFIIFNNNGIDIK